MAAWLRRKFFIRSIYNAVYRKNNNNQIKLNFMITRRSFVKKAAGTSLVFGAGIAETSAYPIEIWESRCSRIPGAAGACYWDATEVNYMCEGECTRGSSGSKYFVRIYCNRTDDIFGGYSLTPVTCRER